MKQPDELALGHAVGMALLSLMDSLSDGNAIVAATAAGIVMARTLARMKPRPGQDEAAAQARTLELVGRMADAHRARLKMENS